jgi:hypothetical protein
VSVLRSVTLFRRQWFKDVAAPLPTEHLTNFDHLFDHLSVGVYGVPCGWTELRESGKSAFYGGSWGSLGA